jgi:hypothetical protein
VLPPVIAKQFSPSPILAGGTSTLTFIITNPSQDDRCREWRSPIHSPCHRAR